MELLAPAVVVASLAAAALAFHAQRKAARRCRSTDESIARIKGEQRRVLDALALAEQASSRILTPGELKNTLERIANEAAGLLDAQGVRLEIKSLDGKGEPSILYSGHFPESTDIPGRPPRGVGGETLGAILTIPIRSGEHGLGELRVAERPDRPLNTLEIHVARLLAQVVAIAAEYRNQREALEKAEEDKRRFVLATTHDLRSPVATIEQLAQVLREGYAGEMTEKQKELAAKIHGRATHLLGLLSDLLSLAIEDQQLDQMRPVAPVSLAAVFDSQIEAARVACEGRGVELIASRQDSPMMRMAAQGDIENIFANLLSNAVKYTPRGGRITATLEDSPGGVLFRVLDTGIGIPKDSLPRLFVEYYRAPNAREIERHGTGLGLALVQKLLRKYMGRIRIDSTEGKGTLAEVMLPPE
ncbi:MAG: HAMP domain-containing histidine kinase [Candidatus Eisenbacteria bacterium]|nr:HAMP domain-containing histidine kinase [Candidatus Eisenbacteria bacterium]